MSSIYILEPPTRGKVVVKTTCGPLDFELWSKEAPKACRNFVQLCMEGYYDGTIFHRVIREFMIQGGDRTGTGTGGESIYGEPFADEFHTRLKFRHRGFLACANAGAKNSNNSQFFMTLDRCDWLNDKHTIFGKVTGDTIYNLLKLGECDTDKDDRPLDPPSIISTEILWNPFEDIVPRNLSKGVDTSAVQQEEQKPVKQKKKLNLLSFGEEALQEEEEISTVKGKIKSSHDVLNDPRLLKGDEIAVETDVDEEKRRKDLQSAVRQALAGKNAKKQSTEEVHSDDDDMSFEVKMRQQVLEKRKRLDDLQGTKDKVGSSKDRALKRPTSEGEEEEEMKAEERKDKLVIKRHGLGSEAKAELAAKREAETQLLSPLEQQRQKYKQKRRALQGREETTLSLLNKFKEKLSQAKAQASEKAAEISENGTGEDVEWMNHRLEFAVDLAKKDKMARNDDIDHYVVYDPLVVKGKEQFNKMQAKQKRRNREWAGKSLT